MIYYNIGFMMGDNWVYGNMEKPTRAAIVWLIPGEFFG
jgi:hypothetical protein